MPMSFYAYSHVYFGRNNREMKNVSYKKCRNVMDQPLWSLYAPSMYNATFSGGFLDKLLEGYHLTTPLCFTYNVVGGGLKSLLPKNIVVGRCK